MTRRPIIAVTATTDLTRDAHRVRLNAAYTRAVERAGGVPIVLPPLDDPLALEDAMSFADGLLLTGGEDVDPACYGQAPHALLGKTNPARDATELAVVAAARERALPTLAICRGVQLLNVACGGSLVQDIPSQWPGAIPHDPEGPRDARVHEVDLDQDSRLARTLGSEVLQVNSIHHQALDRLGQGLRVTARAPDGIVEGVEWADDEWWAVGVQWHPEELTETSEPWDRALFAAFIDRARGGARA